MIPEQKENIEARGGLRQTLAQEVEKGRSQQLKIRGHPKGEGPISPRTKREEKEGRVDLTETR